MTRQERVSLHKKQERLQVGDGVPSVTDMKEGVPELRYVEGAGLTEYTRFNNVLHEKVLDKSNEKEVVKDDICFYLYASAAQSNIAATAYNRPEYMIDSNGFVHLRGMLKDGDAANDVMFSLPEGFRPTYRNLFASYSNSGVCRIDVDTDGDVHAQTGGSTTWTSIDGLIFEGH